MKLLRFLSVLAASFLLVGTGARGAVVISVSPSVISNDYRGVITLNITGLTNGQSVRVEKFADFNQNGVFDPGIGEALFQSFVLTDGVGSPVFAGVTNVNVPGDTDGAANGDIAARLYAANGAEGNRSAGRWVYRVMNAAAPDELARATLTVNQAAFSQRVTGTVSAAGGVVLSNAFVLVLGGANGSLVSIGLSDASGVYSIQLPPGNYSINAAKSGYVTRFEQSASAVLGAGAVVTANVQLDAAVKTVSGRVRDTVTSQGIAGVQVTTGNDSPNGFGLGFTDANGDYTIGVPAAANSVEVSRFSLATVGYVAPSMDTMFDTTIANATAVNIGVTPANALLWGVLTNRLGQPVGGVSIEAEDPPATNFRAVGVSDATDGRYFVGVTSGSLNFRLDSDDLQARGLLPSPSNLTAGNVATNGALRADLLAVAPSAHLRGRVVDAGGNGLEGMTVWASPQAGGGSFNAVTDGTGAFNIGVGTGTYFVGISTESLQSPERIGSMETRVVVDGVDQDNLLLVAVAVTRHIIGQVTGGGRRLGGVNVYAFARVDGTNFNANAMTDGTGHYSLGVFASPSWWIAGVSSEDLTSRGFLALGSQSVSISSSDVTVNFSAGRPDARFIGRVLDENSNPVAGANVYAAVPSGGGSFNGRTDGAGNFDLGVSVGSYSVGVSSDVATMNYVPGPSLSLTAVSGVNQSDLVLRVRTATRRITGRLTGNGAAVVGADVYAYATVGGETFNANTQTDGNGQFSLTVFDATWQVGVSGQDLSNRGLPGVNDRAVTVSGADAVVDIIIISNPSRPTLQVRPRVGGLFQVRILGQAGPRYLLQSSTSLLPGQWSTVIDTNSPSASFDVVDPNSGAGQVRKFYRVTVTP